jgi:hypothetical protein
MTTYTSTTISYSGKRPEPSSKPTPHIFKPMPKSMSKSSESQDPSWAWSIQQRSKTPTQTTTVTLPITTTKVDGQTLIGCEWEQHWGSRQW